MMQRNVGPECPSCGVADSELVNTAVRRKRAEDGTVAESAVEQRACNYCSRRFWADAPPQADVVLVPVCCPHCRSRATRVTSTRGRDRFHRCDFCKKSFRSVEVERQ
jgi:ssDNA-binding Zn-finger/Zn-ribbon topoisomerase 1